MNDPTILVKPTVTTGKDPEKSPIEVFHQTEDAASMTNTKPLIRHPIMKKFHVPSQLKNVMTENVAPENDDTVNDATENVAAENMIRSKVSDEEAHIHSYVIIKEEYIEPCDQNPEEMSTLFETL